jgi:hypothetical protein
VFKIGVGGQQAQCTKQLALRPPGAVVSKLKATCGHIQKSRANVYLFSQVGLTTQAASIACRWNLCDSTRRVHKANSLSRVHTLPVRVYM